LKRAARGNQERLDLLITALRSNVQARDIFEQEWHGHVKPTANE
jgi:hypothetical protein